jgi:hypothetical protein
MKRKIQVRKSNGLTHVYYNRRRAYGFRAGESKLGRVWRMTKLYFSCLLIVGFIGAELTMAFLPKAAEAEPEERTVQVIDESVPEVLHRIAECESGSQHFDAKGNVLRGKKDRNDIGRYQISITYYGAKAMEMGYNLFDEKENEAFAIWIFENEGSDPWVKTKKCWK